MSDPADRKSASSTPATDDRRHSDRLEFGGTVAVRFGDLEIVGPGRNLSTTGVYFVTEASARVAVLVDGVERAAELVRVESLGNGKLGIAVRFVDANTSDGSSD